MRPSSSIFFQADVREAGTLTEYELSGAMRSVMGAAPKAGETSRVLRFFGEKGAQGEKRKGHEERGRCNVYSRGDDCYGGIPCSIIGPVCAVI